MTSTLPGASAPQLVTLSLTAPSLALTPAVSPVAYRPARPVAASPQAAVALAQGPLPILPASSIAAARGAEVKPAPVGALAVAKEILGDAPQDLEKTPVGELIDSTKRLFGESSRPGYQSADYLRPGEAFEFGSGEVFRYRTALSVPYAKSGAEELKTLISAAEGMAKSAGIAVEADERAGHDGVMRPVLKITPQRRGHRLNRLAWDMKKNFDSDIEYAPHRTDGGVAAYNSAERVLFLPDFGREDSFEAILHESRHAAFAKRLRRGDLSPFHASLLAYPGRTIARGAMTYDRYMSLEELSTHAKTLLHQIIRAQRGDSGAVSAAVTNAFQFMDLLRSAEINLFQLRRQLDKGVLTSYVVRGDTWPPIAGGHWEAINLPNAILVLPVLDEAPAPKRRLFDRLFKPAPETPALRAARRHAEALRPLAESLADELEPFLGALRGEPDLKKARESALRMVSAAAKAEDRFAASR